MTGPDPAMLPPGALSYMRNCCYLPSSHALQRARGRAAAGTVTASAGEINGLRDMKFDNGTHILVAQASNVGNAAYCTAAVADTLTWGNLTTSMVAGEQLESVHYGNRFYLFNGVSANASSIGTNAVMFLTATAAGVTATLRQHGMVPVPGPPATATAAAVPAIDAIGFYEYWTTEVYKFFQDNLEQELESTFVGAPVTVYIPSLTTSATRIEKPSHSNGVTTHWRIYRSPIKVYSTDKSFPVGFRIADNSTAVTSVVDTSTSTLGSYIFPATFSDSFNFSNPSRLAADDGSYASGASGAGPDVFGKWSTPIVIPGWRQRCYGFNFGGFQGPVIGIEAEMQAYQDTAGTTQIALKIGRRRVEDGDFEYGGKNATRYATLTATVASAPGQTITFGGATDRWIPSDYPGFSDTDFDTNFMAEIRGQRDVQIDYLKIRVSYGAAAGKEGIEPFPTVVYTFGDIASQVGKNGQPPSSSTGDIYQDSLVVNDVMAPKIIRYSFPGKPDYFPSTYYLFFETSDNDQVKCVKVVNNRLVVGLTNSIWRVNYLPNERDASFDRGLAVEPMSRNVGIVNPMCACVFSVDGESEILAFVSSKGIHTTQGYGVNTQTQYQNWRGIISTGSGITSTPIALINDSERQELLFYYRNDDLTPETYMCLHLNYGLTHAGRMHGDEGPSRTFETSVKISGPVHMRNNDGGSGGTYAGLRSAWAVPRSNGDTSIFLGYGAGSVAAGAGKVYRETGANIPSLDPNMTWITRRMFLAGESNEARLNELYGYVGSNGLSGGSPALSYTALTTKTNDDAGEVAQSAAIATLGGKKLHKVQFRNIFEGLRVSASVTGNPQNTIAQEYILLDGEGFGAEDAGLG